MDRYKQEGKGKGREGWGMEAEEREDGGWRKKEGRRKKDIP